MQESKPTQKPRRETAHRLDGGVALGDLVAQLLESLLGGAELVVAVRELGVLLLQQLVQVAHLLDLVPQTLVLLKTTNASTTT